MTNDPKKETYEIQLQADGASEGLMIFSSIMLFWALLCLMNSSNGLMDDTARTVTGAIHAFIAVLAGIVLLSELRKRHKKGGRIWVDGERFTVGMPGEAGKTYRFADITRMELIYQMKKKTFGMGMAGEYRQIVYVGNRPVAALNPYEENACRFVGKVNGLLKGEENEDDL